MHIDLTTDKRFPLNSSAKEVSAKEGQFVLESQADSIEFSNKLVEVLKEKAQEHNESCEAKISLNQLKKLYVKNAQSFSSESYPDISRSTYSLAKINSFINWTKLKSEKQDVHPTVLDLVESSELSVEDLNLACSEVEKYELNVAEFDPRHDLFINEGDYPVKLSCRIDL